jgi:hypothetical protein
MQESYRREPVASTRSSDEEHRCSSGKGRLTNAHDRDRARQTAAIELTGGGVSSLLIDRRRRQSDPPRLDALDAG